MTDKPQCENTKMTLKNEIDLLNKKIKKTYFFNERLFENFVSYSAIIGKSLPEHINKFLEKGLEGKIFIRESLTHTEIPVSKDGEIITHVPWNNFLDVWSENKQSYCYDNNVYEHKGLEKVVFKPNETKNKTTYYYIEYTEDGKEEKISIETADNIDYILIYSENLDETDLLNMLYGIIPIKKFKGKIIDKSKALEEILKAENYELLFTIFQELFNEIKDIETIEKVLNYYDPKGDFIPKKRTILDYARENLKLKKQIKELKK